MKKVAWLSAVLLIAYLLTGFAQVKPGERAVVRRFGRVVAQPAPGPWFGLPWLMDRVDRVPVTLRELSVGYEVGADDNSFMPAGQLLCGDQNLVNVQVTIQYAVGDGDAVVAYVLQQERVEPAISRATEAAMAEWVAANKVDDVLILGKTALRDWLAMRVQQQIEPYKLGVRIQSVSVVHLAAPDEVVPDFQRVMIAQAGIRTRENDARQEAERLLRKAQAEENELKQGANAYAEGKNRSAQSEAKSFITRWEQYQILKKDNPDILTAIWWSEMGKVLTTLKMNGNIELLDDRIGADGLDITQFARPKKK